MNAAHRLERLLDHLAQDPRNPHLLADIADEQVRLGDLSAAKWSFEQLMQLQPGEPQWAYRLAVVERARGEPAAALARLQALATAGHHQPVLHIEMGRCHAALGEWLEAAQALAGMTAVTLPRDEADDLWQLRLRALHHMGDLETALREAQAWRGSCGGTLPLRGAATVGTLLLDTGRFAELSQLLDGLDAESVMSSAELSMAAGFAWLNRGDAERALAHFARSAELAPSLARAHLGRGLSEAASGHLPRALEALRQAVQADPTHLGSWHAQAWMQWLSADLRGAAASMHAALEQDDTFGETHGGLALVAALRGDHEASRRHLRTALRLDANGINARVAGLALQQGATALTPALLAEALRHFAQWRSAARPRPPQADL